MFSDGLELFHRFLKSEFSEENLEFWIACEELKGIPEADVANRAQQIYDMFVKVDSLKQVLTLATGGKKEEGINTSDTGKERRRY